MHFELSQKDSSTLVGHLYLHNLKKLFLRVWVEQNTIPFMRFVPFYYQLLRGLKVSFLRSDEYTERVSNGHLAITYLKDGEGRIIFDVEKMAKHYGRLLNTNDVFLLNTYAIIISHELVHLYILRLDRSDRADLHKFLDKYQMGEYSLAEVYKEFRYEGKRVLIYDNKKLIEYYDQLKSIGAIN